MPPPQPSPPPPPPREIQLDACILGGGIAGLWTLAHLRRLRYRAALIELHTLGGGPDGQTLASQGIIHGGIKYALSGAAAAASRAIAAMPEIWQRSLRDAADANDLPGAVLPLRPFLDPARAVLSQTQLLWTTPGVASRLAGAAASKVIRTPVERLAVGQRPPPFDHAAGIDVYRVAEPVLSVGEIIRALIRLAGPRSILALRSGAADLLRIHPLHPGASSGGATGTTGDASRGIASITIDGRQGGGTGGGIDTAAAHASSPITIHAARYIFAAGAGNAALIARTFADAPAGQEPPRMQRRALHMVMLRAPDLPAIFGHCVGLSDKPRVTITTARDRTGRAVWYVGGQLAELGVSRSPAEQVAAAKQELAACLPWLNLASLAPEWATWRVDRAEGLTPRGDRPDEPVIAAIGNVISAWPTKLAFAPLVAERIAAMMPPVVTGAADPAGPLSGLLRATDTDLDSLIAAYPWDRSEVPWTP
ncbi:MAG: FAD-dependent oxidoreductase [Phycisphaerales bacterium]